MRRARLGSVKPEPAPKPLPSAARGAGLGVGQRLFWANASSARGHFEDVDVNGSAQLRPVRWRDRGALSRYDVAATMLGRLLRRLRTSRGKESAAPGRRRIPRRDGVSIRRAACIEQRRPGRRVGARGAHTFGGQWQRAARRRGEAPSRRVSERREPRAGATTARLHLHRRATAMASAHGGQGRRADCRAPAIGSIGMSTGMAGTSGCGLSGASAWSTRSDDHLARIHVGEERLLVAVNAVSNLAITPRRRTAVVVSMRDEGISILEWLAHYRVLGFDDIFIYTNDNVDGSDELLSVLAEEGVVYLLRNDSAPTTWPQHKCYNHALHLLRALRDCEWVLFADADELLMLAPRFEHSIVKYLHEAKEAVGSELSAVCFHWRWFGSGRAFARTDGLMIERFQQGHSNRHVKSIVRLRDALSMHHVHVPVLSPGRKAVTSGFLPCPALSHEMPADYSGGQLNHYWNKSFQEFVFKRRRGDGTLGAGAAAKDFATFFEWGQAERPLEAPDSAMVRKVQKELGALLSVPRIRQASALVERRFQEMLERYDRQSSLRELDDGHARAVGRVCRRCARRALSRVGWPAPATARRVCPSCGGRDVGMEGPSKQSDGRTSASTLPRSMPLNVECRHAAAHCPWHAPLGHVACRVVARERGPPRGRPPAGANASNPRGHFEDEDFVEFEQAVLRELGLSPDGWVTTTPAAVPAALAAHARALIDRKQRAGRPWGWRIPRTVPLLPLWRPLLPEARFAIVTAPRGKWWSRCCAVVTRPSPPTPSWRCRCGGTTTSCCSTWCWRRPNAACSATWTRLPPTRRGGSPRWPRARARRSRRRALPSSSPRCCTATGRASARACSSATIPGWSISTRASSNWPTARTARARRCRGPRSTPPPSGAWPCATGPRPPGRTAPSGARPVGAGPARPRATARPAGARVAEARRPSSRPACGSAISSCASGVARSAVPRREPHARHVFPWVEQAAIHEFLPRNDFMSRHCARYSASPLVEGPLPFADATFDLVVTQDLHSNTSSSRTRCCARLRGS